MAAELNCTLPKYKFICALYLGKTNFKYQFTGLTTLGCLADIYILNMYLKRINKKKICEYILWNLWHYVSDNWSRESGSGVRVGHQKSSWSHSRSRSFSECKESESESESDFFNPTPQPWFKHCDYWHLIHCLFKIINLTATSNLSNNLWYIITVSKTICT